MKPRSRILDVPGTSVSVPATRPAVQDSAVATNTFFRLQMASRRFAASTMSSSSIGVGPRQSDGRIGIGDHAFALADKAHFFVGRRLHADAVDRNPGDAGNTLAYGVAMRADLWGLRDKGQVEMHDTAFTFLHSLDGKTQEPV